MGKPLPHVEVKIADAEGAAVAHGCSGELLVRGFGVMKGYFKMPEKTAETIDVDGWLHSGDIATMDAQGYVRITGRIKDMIIRGGENIYPREIEEFLLTHPQVLDAQVFGVADEKFGEAVCAWIIPRPGETLAADAVRQYCQGRIAHFKVPAHIRIVERFAMTVTGKAQKFEMRKIMEAEIRAQANEMSGS